MEQIQDNKQPIFIATDYCYFSCIQSNYANYFHSSTTKNSALIDVLENAILVTDKEIENKE